MYPIKRGWKPVTSGRIYNLYMEVVNRAQELELWGKVCPPPLFTRKSTKSFGTCFVKKNGGKSDGAIVLNEMLANYSDDQIRKIIVHEVAHAVCPWEHHSELWRNTADSIGQKWGYKTERLNTDEELCADIAKMNEEKNPYKYELYCPKCGAVWKYKRMCKSVKHPENYWCDNDKTKLLCRKVKK